MAKKIMALVMTIALVVCFAVSASAAYVSTTTTYVNGNADVTVKVTGIAAGTDVTYYATKGGSDVYVNQEEATDEGVTFNFETPYDNVGSNVIIGYTNVETADEKDIPAAQYTITYEGADLGSVNHGANETVTVANPVGAHENIASVNATNTESVSYSESGSNLVITLTNVTGDVVITIAKETETIPGYQGLVDIVEAAAIVVKADAEGKIKNDVVIENGAELKDDERVSAAENNRKLTVCGKVEGDFTEYGIIVSKDMIATENLWAEDFETKYADCKYKAGTKAADGKFAVQLIDTSDNGADSSFVVAGQAYYVAVYAKTATACYVDAYAETVTAN